MCQVRALVVLPTKELAQQVYVGPCLEVRAGGFVPAARGLRSRCSWLLFLQVSKVFSVYTGATPLRVALVTGQKSLAKEQESLVQDT